MNGVYVIDFLGGPDAVLAFLPPALIKAAKETCMFSLLTGNLLATVLSYVDRKDVYSVIRVCRSWSTIPYTHRRVFWSRMVGRLVPFDTFFAIPKQLPTRWDETLRQQVEWIFRPGWYNVHNGVYKRRTHDGFVLKYVQSSGLYKIYTESKSVFFNQDKKKPLWTLENNEFAWEAKSADAITGNMVFRTKDGCLFVGQYLDDDGAFPHGDGCWTFPDGTTLEGTGVAWRGEPRQPYKKIKTAAPF